MRARRWILQSMADRRTRTHHLAELLLPEVDGEDTTILHLHRIDQLLSDFEGDTQQQFYLLVGLYALRHQHEETGRKFLRLARETDEPRSHIQALIAGGSAMEKIQAHGERQPQPVDEVCENVPAELTAVIGKVMAKEPEKRYQTPVEVAFALTRSSI